MPGDENAADQLYRIMAEEFYGVTNLEETWEGWTWRMVGATGKTVGGGLAAVGGGLLAISPEPVLTKAAGAGALVCGTNTLLDGVTQFGQREGGTNLAGIAADGYQTAVQGELPSEWYLRSRTYVMLGSTAFELVGTGGFSKFLRTTPVRTLPTATKAALTRGYEKLATKLGAKGAKQARRTLYHYTNEEGLRGIVKSGNLRPSLKSLNPNDVRYGNGQYFSDFVPGTKTPAQLSRQFLGQPFQGSKYTHFVEIDVTGLKVIEGRAGVFVIPNETPLDLAGRIVGSGQVP